VAATDRRLVPAQVFMHGTVRATRARRAASTTVDVALVVAVACTGWLLGWIWAALLAAVAVAGVVAGLRRTGQGVGQRWLGLRVVDRDTALPGSPRALAARRCVTVDLRRGRDPLCVTPRPRPAGTSAAEAWVRHGRSGVPVLVADDGSRWPITAPTLIGRKASDPTGRYRTVTIPDVSKTLSRNHAVLEPGPGGLVVTDVGSANGTGVYQGGHLVLIDRDQPVTVPPGTRLGLGTRVFEVRHEQR